MEGALRESHATWKIVVGHHTIKSASIHGTTQELVQKLLPILEVIIFIATINLIYKYKLAMYKNIRLYLNMPMNYKYTYIYEYIPKSNKI